MEQPDFDCLQHTMVRGLHQLPHELVLNRDFVIIDGLPVMTYAGVIRALSLQGRKIVDATSAAVLRELDARNRIDSDEDEDDDVEGRFGPEVEEHLL